MKAFGYVRPSSVEDACAAVAARPGARFLGGGTNLVDLMKLGVEEPADLVDVTRLPLDTVEELPDGSLRIGAMVRNSDLAAHPAVRDRYPVLSQALLAVTLDGAEVTTVEGLTGNGEGPHPLQQAFLDRDAFQCGYCTPGQICSAVGMLAEASDGHPSRVTEPGAPSGRPVALDRDEIRERLSGNLCRCGAYPHIVDAVEDVIL